ncbi:MAG: hypothetical protein AAFO75_10130 [Pseudomonadota bacterium]
MTAASLNGLRSGNAAADFQDERMDQIRELLIGDLVREFEQKIARLEGRVQSLEHDLAKRAEALNMRLEALAGEVTADRRSAFDELSKGIAELGQHIKQVSRT